MMEKTLWPGWKTGEVIGKGSFGCVYEIENLETGEKTALKRISIPQNESELEEMYGDGFTKETVASAYIQQRNDIMSEYAFMKDLGDCPHVVSCEDFRFEPHDDGIGWDIYIKMELLTPLTRVVADEMPEEQVLQLAADLCNALEHCKERGILHRDIKPQNIFLSPEGIYKLGDFGVAKAAEGTMGGTKIGTYKYMAPEVYNNQPYGSGADVYSLGLVLYWLLNERRMPFVPLPPVVPTHSDEDRAKERRFSGEPLPAPKYGSEDLKQVVLKACAFDPKERYRSAAQMRQDLEAVMRGKPICLAVVAGDGTIDPHNSQNVIHRQFCKNCGAPVFPNVKFCRKCGSEVIVAPVVPVDVFPEGPELQEPEMQGAAPSGVKKLLGNKKLVIGGIIGCGVLVVAMILVLILVPLVRYNNAVDLMESGDYQGAIAAFAELDDYKDSQAKITECRYHQAVIWFNEGKYPEAQTEFEALGSYQDSANMVTQCKYGKAVTWYGEGKYNEALVVFEDLGDYEDSRAMVIQCKLGQADDLLEAGKYDEALAAYESLGDYPEKVKACKYGKAVTLMENRNYESAIFLLEQLGSYKDAPELVMECKYNWGIDLLSEGNVVDGYETLRDLGNYKDSADRAKTVEKTYKRIQGKSYVFAWSAYWYAYDPTYGYSNDKLYVNVVDQNTVKITLQLNPGIHGMNWWQFTCRWDASTGRLNYSDGEKRYYTSDIHYTVSYTGGKGYFYCEGGLLYWVDQTENCYQSTEFYYVRER